MQAGYAKRSQIVMLLLADRMANKLTNPSGRLLEVTR